jgi:glycosyltransferase involved in cell wall biosynthesis
VSEGSTIPIGADGQLKLAFLGDPNSIHMRLWVGFLAGRGHRVTLLVAKDRVVEPGLPASIAIDYFTSFAAGRRVTPVSLIRGRRSLRGSLARIQPDILNAHFLTVHGWNAWMSGFHPYVVTLWGSDIFIHPKKSRVAALLARLTLRAADMVMINPVMRQAALEAGAPPEKLEPVTIGVDVSRFTPGPDPAALRARLRLEGRRVVFSPRSIAPLYRQGIVVEALAQLPSDVVVLMPRFRAQPDELAKIERQAEALGLSDRVVIVPEIAHTEMPDFYRLADVVVSVPESDSAAVTMLEALACGRPFVATDLPAIREWLGDLEGPELVPVDEALATAAALRRALEKSPEARVEQAARLRGSVVERADQARTLARMESLYLELVQHRRGADEQDS